MNPKSILLNVTGLTPQVVTETLYALHQQGQALPEQLHILTTAEGYPAGPANPDQRRLAGALLS